MNSTAFPPAPSRDFVFPILFDLFAAFLSYDAFCTDSLHISFLLSAINYCLTMTVQCLQESLTLSRQVRNKLESLSYVLFGPVASGIAILGVIWWFVYRTSRCNSAIFALIWLLLKIGIHLEISMIAYEKFQIWWDFYKAGLLDTVPYHPNRDESMRDGQEMQEIRAGLLQADHEIGPLRNTMREKTCSICYVDFEIGEKVVDVPNCLHTFHEECIAAWLEKSYKCPMCRGTVRKTGQRPRANRNV